VKALFFRKKALSQIHLYFSIFSELRKCLQLPIFAYHIIFSIFHEIFLYFLCVLPNEIVVIFLFFSFAAKMPSYYTCFPCKNLHFVFFLLNIKRRPLHARVFAPDAAMVFFVLFYVIRYISTHIGSSEVNFPRGFSLNALILCKRSIFALSSSLSISPVRI